MRRPVGKERCGVPGCARLEKKLGKLVLIRDQDTNLEEFLWGEDKKRLLLQHYPHVPI